MGLLDDRCMQCGEELGDDPVERDGKEFCSEEHAEQFAEEHGPGDHNTEEDQDVCRFC
ncbi:MAG: hypothetical protein MUP66_04250 [Candidatus Nanohaloarchaeota archaeon QJJ-5]|nr:hypothetical protein [Candidatus Nanohaloarchaeota archaeon QJJ-5]